MITIWALDNQLVYMTGLVSSQMIMIYDPLGVSWGHLMFAKKIVVKSNLTQFKCPTTYNRNCGHNCGLKSRITTWFFLTEAHMKIPKMTPVNAVSPRTGSPTPGPQTTTGLCKWQASTPACSSTCMSRGYLCSYMPNTHTELSAFLTGLPSWKVWGPLA